MPIEEKTPAEWCDYALTLIETPESEELAQDVRLTRIIKITASIHARLMGEVLPALSLNDADRLFYDIADIKGIYAQYQGAMTYIEELFDRKNEPERRIAFAKILITHAKRIFEIIQTERILFDSHMPKRFAESAMQLTFKD